MRYSQTLQNFYPDDIDYLVLPDDIINVKQADFDAAMLRESDDTLDVVNGQVIIVPKPPASLDELKQLKTTEITAALTDALDAGFTTTSGIKMDADISDVQILKSAYDLMILLNQKTLPILVDYDNVPHVDMALKDILAIIIEVAVNYQTLYAKKQSLRGQVLAVKEEGELDKINW
jgi:hypothetical protein